MTAFTDRIVLLLTFLFLHLTFGERQYFTSMQNMKSLSAAELRTVGELEEYAAQLTREIKLMKSAIRNIKQRQSANVTVEEMIKNPLDVYQLIKRWSRVTSIVTRGKEHVPCLDLDTQCETWAEEGECEFEPDFMTVECARACGLCPSMRPTDEDVSAILEHTSDGPVSVDDFAGSATALIRLIRTYKLKITNVMAGRIKGFEPQLPLNLADAIYLARMAIAETEKGYASQFLKYVIKNTSNTTKSDLALKHEAGVLLAILYSKHEDPFRAARTVKEVLGGCIDESLACEKVKAKGSCEKVAAIRKTQCRYTCGTCELHYHGPELKEEGERLAKAAALQIRNRRDMYKDLTTERGPAPDWSLPYERLCRGEGSVQVPSYCTYRDTVIPIVKFKEEVLYEDPRISRIYDIISDKEAAECIKFAEDKLFRSRLGVGSRHDDRRVSSASRFNDTEPLARKLSARVQLVTGLRTITLPTLGDPEPNSSDALQLLNYGLGGQYEPHYDYNIMWSMGAIEVKEDEENLVIRNLVKSGDRIATVLFYLTDVAGGGRTVFPNLDVSVPSWKNAATFWFNSKMSGEYDFRTLHAGCPVLLGEKWAINKWIREYGNEFNRKCGPTEDFISRTGLT